MNILVTGGAGYIGSHTLIELITVGHSVVVVDKRMKRDKKWYAYKTVMTLMQAYGRGMRAEDDSCYTYIIDSDINMLFKSPMYRSLIPDFFKEAVVRVKK